MSMSNLGSHVGITAGTTIPQNNVQPSHLKESATFQIEEIQRKVLTDAQKEPMSEAENEYLNTLNREYEPLTAKEKSHFILLRRNKSLSKKQKEYFSHLGIRKYEPLTHNEKATLSQCYLSFVLDHKPLSEAEKFEFSKWRTQRSLSEREKNCFLSLGIGVKTSLSEQEKTKLTCLKTRDTNITVREKSQLIGLLKTRALTSEEKDCLARFNVSKKEPLKKTEEDELIRLNAKKSELNNQEKEILTDLRRTRSLTAKQEEQFDQLNIFSESFLTKKEKEYLTGLFKYIASSTQEENPTLKEGLAKGFCTDKQKAAFQEVFKEHYDTALAYSLGINTNALDGGDVDEEESLDILPDWVGCDPAVMTSTKDYSIKHTP